MINEKYVRLYCKDSISLIENYDKAVADTDQMWDCHHRDEIRLLPSGMIARRSVTELKENGRYFNCPANELIFLTPSEHAKLHMTGNNHPLYGTRCSEETKRKISNTEKGKQHSDEAKRKISEASTRNNSGRTWFTNGVINKFARVCPVGFVKGRIMKNMKNCY